jgi:hypothetical protein
MFIRTDSGLSNRAIFTKSEFTLYVEGGGGIAGNGSLDTIYWREMFRKIRPELRLSIIATGGKPQLETIAEKIESGAINNTLVAMDSDFDDFLGEKIEYRHVIYTYGYSWECDVYNLEVILDMISRISQRGTLAEETSEEIKAIYRETLNKLLPYINADFYLRSVNCSLFPSISPGRFIKNAAISHAVEINLTEVRKVYKEKLKNLPPEKRRRQASVYILTASEFLHGHTLQAFVKCLCNYALRRLGQRPTATDQLIEQLSIFIFGAAIDSGDTTLCSHYKNKLRAV